jgi:hypothetical protein
VNTMDLPLALVAPNDDPLATQRAIERAQRSQRKYSDARRDSDRRWAAKRAIQRREVREERLRAQQAGIVPLPEQQIARRENVLAGRVRAHLQNLQEAYERGDGFHPETGAYKDEESLTPSKRGALIAWRKGYRVTDDGRFWHPKGYELFPGHTMNIVPGPKHHRRFTDPQQRTRQQRIPYRPAMLAALCFYGPPALREDRRLHFVDGNRQHCRRDNLLLWTKDEEERHRQKHYRQAPSPTYPNGRLKYRQQMNPERAQAIRQLLALGKSRKEVVALLTARQFPITLVTVAAIDCGARWR